MATLTQAEKVILRRVTARKAGEAGVPVRWVKACLHDAGQAIENILDSTAFKAQVSDAIDSAASPYGVSFTNTEKRWLVAFIMELKRTRDLLG